MFSLLGQRAFPALFIVFGFVLLAYGVIAYNRVDETHEAHVYNLVEKKLVQDLTLEYGSSAVLRATSKMSEEEIADMRAERRADLMAEHGEELNAIRDRKKRGALLRLGLGVLMFSFGGWLYARGFRARRREKNEMQA